MSETPNEGIVRHCPRCGAEGLDWPSRKQIRCRACGFHFFLNVASAVVAILRCEGKLLLSVRGIEPGKGMLDLPGGFLEPGESGEEAVRRELMEELGLDVTGPRYLFSFPNRYFHGDVWYDVLDLFFLVDLSEVPQLTPMDDVSAVRWVEPAEIDFGRIAFDSIRSGLGRFVREFGHGGPSA